MRGNKIRFNLVSQPDPNIMHDRTFISKPKDCMKFPICPDFGHQHVIGFKELLKAVHYLSVTYRVVMYMNSPFVILANC